MKKLKIFILLSTSVLILLTACGVKPTVKNAGAAEMIAITDEAQTDFDEVELIRQEETVSDPFFIRYDFDTVEILPDSGSGVGFPPLSSLKQEGEMIFEPVDIENSWLAELAGGANLKVSVGILDFGNGAVTERYIDIQGENGEARLLQNSAAAQDDYNMTLFWSAKQQEGSSVVKNFNGEIKCAVLYEFEDGSCYLWGYIEGDGTDFWTLELPTSNYYGFIKET